MNITENIKIIEDKIQISAQKSGRKLSDISLIAVSKTKPNELINQAFNAGLVNFGENKIQEAKQKFETLNNPKINWHIIGGVQTNKVKYLPKFCSLLHSLDRLELAEEIQKKYSAINKNLNCLIQINISGEISKSGIEPSEAKTFLKQLEAFSNINICGIMAIAENTENAEKIRDNFKKMKEVFENLNNIKNTNSEMKFLSMGMSDDFEMAIEEGANMVRIGSKIFGNR
jgi:hypothetical protein